VDFRPLVLRRGRGSLSRRQPLARAVGRGRRRVADATAGLGQDAALLALLGHEVTAIERSPILAAMLEDGLERAEADLAVAAALGGRLRVVRGDARDALERLVPPPDVVYIDPMFPPKRKSSALAKKGIRLVRRLVGDDEDAAALLAVALRRARDRVVVKRPTAAGPLGGDPALSFAGKLARYDVYLVGCGDGAGSAAISPVTAPTSPRSP
jgi:16S rRNA (guanine1516-N2)-methyltransferase